MLTWQRCYPAAAVLSARLHSSACSCRCPPCLRAMRAAASKPAPETALKAPCLQLSVDGQVVGSLEVLDGTPKAHQAGQCRVSGVYAAYAGY